MIKLLRLDILDHRKVIFGWTKILTKRDNININGTKILCGMN